MKRKILSLLLIAALLAVMMPMSAFADTGGLIVSSTSIHSGDSFTISYVVPNETTTVGSISLKIKYDKAKLKITSVNWKSFSNSSPTGSNVSEAQSVGTLSGVWENEDNEITIPASTELVKAEFTTADGASAGDAQFTIEQISIKGGAMGMDDLNSIAGVTTTGKTVSIELPANSITITGNPQKTYDGNPATDPAVDKTSADGIVSYEYYNDNSGSPASTPLGSAPANAGKYWVKAKVSGSATHADATSQAKSFTIGRAGYTYAGPAVSTTTYVGASYPASESVIATGVGSEVVNGTLSWFTDPECNTEATGTFEAKGQKTLYWKFTPAAEAINYVADTKTGNMTFEVGNLPEQEVSFANAGPIEKTYGDAAFTNSANNTTSGGGALSYSSSNESVATVNSTGEVTIKGAGTVTIKATAAEVAGNYGKTEKTYTLNVAPKTLHSSDLERADSNATTKVYDGNDNAEGIAYKVKDASKVNAGDAITINGSAKYNSKDVATASNIIFTPEAITTGNYALASTETVEIKGASITARPITVTVNEVHRDYLADNPTFTGTVPDGALAAGDNYAGLGLTFTTTATNASNAGSYDVTKAGCANTNYNVTVNGTGKLIVDKIAPTYDDLDVDIPTSPIYNGTPQKATVTAKTGIVGLGTITVKYDGNSSAPTDAKTYAVTVDIAEETNYTAVNGLSVGNLEIQKAALTLPSAAVTSKTYDGKDTAAITPGALAGVVATDAGKVAVEQTSVAGKFASVNVGSNIAVTTSAKFTLTGDRAGNYTLTQPADLKGTINPCTSVTDQTQTGSAEDPLTVVKGVGTFPEAIFGGVNGETATGTVKYSYGSVSNETWDAVKEVLKSQAAGTTGTVSYTFTGTENYAGASASGSINFKIVDIAFYLEGTETIADVANAVTLADDKTYGKTWDELLTLKNMTAKVGSASVEGEFSLDVAGTPDAGAQTYSVKFTGGSYTDITVFSGNITVEQREVVISWNNYENRVYNDGKTVTATITNKVGTDDVDLSVTGGDAINAGTGYTATAALTGADAANYKLPAEYTKAYSIAKATPTVSVTFTKITEKDETLADAALTKASSSVEGTLAWDDVDTTVVTQGTAYGWTFTPTDTANYNTVTGSVTPWANPVVIGGGGLPTTPSDQPIQSGKTTSVDMSGSTVSKGGQTTTTVDKKAADKLVETAVSNKSEEIVISAVTKNQSAASSIKSSEVALPTKTLQTIADKTNADIVIKTDVAEVKLDNKAAEAVASQAQAGTAGKNETVSIVAEKVKEEAKEVRYELKVVTSSGTVISDFNGGNVSVTINVPKSLSNKKIVCVYIDENGFMHKMDGRLNSNGTYSFTTGHFSTYAIMSEEEVNEAIKEQKEAVKALKLKLRSELIKRTNGKKAVKLTWTNPSDIELDGVEIYRSVKKNSGYGKKPIYVSKSGMYINTSVKAGKKYYYKVRGFVTIDGEKVYTEYSAKAYRTVK